MTAHVAATWAEPLLRLHPFNPSQWLLRDCTSPNDFVQEHYHVLHAPMSASCMEHVHSKHVRLQCKLEPRWLANVPMCGPRWAKALDAVSSLLTRASALESVLEVCAMLWTSSRCC